MIDKRVLFEAYRRTIERGHVDTAELQDAMNKHYTDGKLTEEQYDELYFMLNPPPTDEVTE